MIKRDIRQLTIYQTVEETDVLPWDYLNMVYLNNTSDIIYITKDNVLYGIVCLGDILYHSSEGGAKINKSFTVLKGFNLIKAHEIFKTRSNIAKIPIVNEQGELEGDYSRYDDCLYIERNKSLLIDGEAVKKMLESYEAIYILEPVENNNNNYTYLIQRLDELQLKYTIINREQIGKKLIDKSICIFMNEDERRSAQCLYRIELSTSDIVLNGQNRTKFITYKKLLYQIMEYIQFKRLNINKPESLPYNRIDDKATTLLMELERRSIKCFTLYDNERKLTEYGRKFKNEANERLKVQILKQEEQRLWPRKIENSDFFGELYQIEDYEKEIAQKELVCSSLSFEYKKNISGKYFNAINGRRVTCNQPEIYVGTIYILGPCVVVGMLAEDQYTIASYLQKKLLERGYAYRVENCGSMLRSDADIENRLQEIGMYGTNDIVIYLSQIGESIGIQGQSLEKIFERHEVPSRWVSDPNTYMHCNYKANKFIADDILDMIETYLTDKNTDNPKHMHIDVCDIMKDYVRRKYLEQYFKHFNPERYGTIGSIVMNCNPFSKGHRYLIEQARQQVELLIIFAVEEDESLFPFEERFRLIEEGTADFDNVIVVPSGNFILSKNNFNEYFMKQGNDTELFDYDATSFNAEYDINVFADYIAKPLHITHRFAGEEPEDRVTNIYNEAMKQILPAKGINFVEIPRISFNNEIVSASKVRQYLKNEEYDKAFTLLPETTKQYLMSQMGYA